MVRPPDELASTNRIEVLAKYGKFYTNSTHTGEAHQLYFFSKYYDHCTAMLIFGGQVYRQRGGWAWIVGKKKHLQAIYKLLEPFDGEISDSIKSFMEWMKTKGDG